MTRVLFLHGSSAGPGGSKASALRREPDFHVEEPALPFPTWRPRGALDVARWGAEALHAAVFERGCRVAQDAAAAFEPDVIVGSSMGGVIAIGIDSPAARVLIAPATEIKSFGIIVPNPVAGRRVAVRTVILHAEEDSLVPFAASLRLLQTAANHADPGDVAVMTVIQEHLLSAGYDTRHGRLIRIGHDHQCNRPHPHDTWNRDPDPHRAMVRAVRILAAIES